MIRECKQSIEILLFRKQKVANLAAYISSSKVLIGFSWKTSPYSWQKCHSVIPTQVGIYIERTRLHGLPMDADLRRHDNDFPTKLI